ncbi:MAG: hypothetical protein IJ445_07455 [Clostridia bacterium]|nr:hypothetical protein [Clostridia bacterium]
MKNNDVTRYEKFRKKHKRLHYLNGFVNFVTPFCLVGLALLIFKPIEGREVLAVYAMVGSFILTIGLMLCLATDYSRYAFFKLNVFFVAIGTILMVLFTVFTCYENIGVELNENILAFQLLCFLALFLHSIGYLTSREAVEDYIAKRTHLNENQMDKRKEGFFNYWWYKKLHKEYGIGFIYYVNVFVTLTLVLFFMCTCALFFSQYLKHIALILCILSACFVTLVEVFAFAQALRNGKSYSEEKNRKSPIKRIPYIFEIGNIICSFGIAVLVVAIYK